MVKKTTYEELEKRIQALERSEKALLENEHRLATHLQETPIGVLSWDLDFKAIEWNPAAETIFGYTKSEALGKHATELILPEDMKEFVDDLFKDLISQKGGAHNTNENITKDGRRIICEWYNTSLTDMEGNVYGVGSLFQDVTERIMSEKLLRESEERFRILFENAPLGYQSLDANGDLIELNETWCKLLGYTKEEVLGKNFSDFIHPDFKEIFKENFPKFKSLGYILGIEFEMIKKDGSEIIVSFDGKIGHKKDGSFKQTHCILNDVSERKQTMDALRDSEKKYRTMMESMKDAAYICSPELRIEYMNAIMINRVGRDATGEICHKAIYDQDKKCSWCVFDQVEKNELVEYEILDPNDNNYYVVSSSPIPHSDGTISKLTIFHDITQIKTIEENLRQAEKMESIGTLAGGIAHDFNNLLYMIVGNTELALEDIPKWNPAYTHLEEIKSASLKAADIVKQLLNFSRKTDLKMIPIQAVTVIKDALKFLRSTIPSTIEIYQHLPEDEIVILADSIQINQVIMNLCINASQAMEETGGRLDIIVKITTAETETAKGFEGLTPGKYLKITVADTGPGISPEIIHRIFDPYFTTQPIGKGSGMGLSIVHGIVKNHGGAISVVSHLDKGTTFRLLFPVVAEKSVDETQTTDGVSLGKETILVVDDEQAITDMTQKVLEKIGYRVETSLNPLTALDLFQSKPDTFDLVITDMTMPQMTGAKLAQKLKEIRSDIPVIICTGHSSLIDEEKATQLGIDGYLMKPVFMAKLAKEIRKVLGP
jgi:PAS domain S-box-containing protein